MDKLPPSMLSIIDGYVKPLEEAKTQLENENQALRERLNVYQSGNQFSRDDYYRLETQLRDEIDKNSRLTRQYRELEATLQTLRTKSQSLESQLSRVNTEINSGVQKNKNNEDQISDLKKKVLEYEKSEKKQRDETFRLIEEKSILNDYINSLSKQNDDLAAAVEQLLSRDIELNKILTERTQSCSEANEKASKYKERCNKLERQLLKVKKGSKVVIEETENNDPDQNADVTTNYLNAQAELEDSKEKIKELKIRILALEEEERRNDRLTEALKQRNITIDKLQKQVDEKEQQILEFNKSKKDLIQRVETYRQLAEERYKENTNEMEELREQMKIYKENYEIADKRVRKLEEESGQKMREADELRKLLDQKLEGTHGLRNVVNEMKELRAMLDVRDRHIADLVSQLNSMDKIMIGLSRQVDPNFDINTFLKTYNTEEFDDEKLRTEKASLDLAKKIQMMKDRGPAAQIKVVLNKDQRPIKTVVYEGDQESFSVNSPQHHKNTHRASDANPSDSIWIPPKQRKKFGQKRYKPTDDNEKEKTKIITTFNEIGIQADSFGEIDDDFTEGFQGSDRDEWVVNLRRKYMAVVKERDDLKKRLAELMADFEKLQNEHKLLQLDMEESGKSGKKQGLDHSLSKSSYNLEFPSSPLATKPYDRSNLTDRASQTKKHKFNIDHQLIYNYHKKMHLTRVNLGSDPKNCVILPSEEDRAIFNAKQDALRAELKKVRKEASEYKNLLDQLRLELSQLLEIKDRMQDTIDRLNKQLMDERERYKENLIQFRNEADRAAESKVKEALDVHKVQNRLSNDLLNLDDANLDNLSTRLKELNHMKSRLEDQLSEERASSQLAQKQCLRYQERLYAAEKERDQLKQELEQRKTDSKLTDYNAELHIRMKNLQKKCQDLKRENAELKQSRPARNDPKQGTEHPIDESDNEDTTNFKNYSLIRSTKSAEAKIMALRTQNEEMQLKLGKAQGTIDRLNQLLQRKEGQVEKLKEQASAFKHQIIAKQKEVNALRTKLKS
ncbi:hypothetical protein M9Y10_008367 [Tritrichomonas musculus]|uniref:Uncharacterized protein n=1 Tax=Tritrichomonas musculus TaxID=1915356 RepID=A0ABR2IXX2_9EUKA